MPSHANNPIRVCVFGDSHYAAWRQALNDELVDLDGIDLEFWGHVGQRFRYLAWKNEQIEPVDEFTENRFAKFNEKQRRVLDPKDFDVLIFAGCRLTTTRLFAQIMHCNMAPEAFATKTAINEIIGYHLRGEVTYHFARKTVKSGKARVLFSPVSFDIEGMDGSELPEFPAAAQAGISDRDLAWDMVQHVMSRDGIDLVRQPEKTVTNGYLTRREYAANLDPERNDRTHKNAAFGELVFNAALQQIREMRARDEF